MTEQRPLILSYTSRDKIVAWFRSHGLAWHGPNIWRSDDGSRVGRITRLNGVWYGAIATEERSLPVAKGCVDGTIAAANASELASKPTGGVPCFSEAQEKPHTPR